MGYIPNSSARSLITNRTDILGVVVPDISNVYTAHFIKHLEKHARENNYFLLIGSTSNSFESEREIIKRFMSKNIDGLIIAPGNYYDETIYKKMISEIKKRGIPFVLSGVRFKNVRCNYVMPDLENGEYLLTKYLLDHGYTDLVFVSGDKENYHCKERFTGFLRAHQTCGLTFDDRRFFNCGDRFDFDDGYRFMDEFLKKNNLPQVFVAINDMVAHGIIKRLYEKNIMVPADVGVVGFDDIDVSTAQRIGLTTMNIPVENMANLCIDIIKNNKNNKDLKQIMIEPELILRDSLPN